MGSSIKLCTEFLILLTLLLIAAGCSDDKVVNEDFRRSTWDVEVSLGEFVVPQSMYDSLPGGQRYHFTSPSLADPVFYDITWKSSTGMPYSPSNTGNFVWDAPDTGQATISLEVNDSRTGTPFAAGSIDLGFDSLGPRLTIPTPSFDFGFVPQHCVASFDFPLFSTGGAMLKIVKIVPG